MTDMLGNKIDVLKSKKLFLIDMDGTIYRENTLFEGVCCFLEQVKKQGGKYIFLSNNSSKSIDEYAVKLQKMGIDATYNDFYISSQATVEYLKSNFNGKKVYCQGTKSLVKVLKDSGIEVVEDVCDDIDVVLVGNDTELTFDKLRNTCELLCRTVAFIATNPDVVCPVGFGYVPDCGSICDMITNATGKKPYYIGKPEPFMINAVMDKYSCSKDETVIIGDRLYTDIASGSNAGITTICVLTGDTTMEDIGISDLKPDYVVKDIKELANAFT